MVEITELVEQLRASALFDQLDNELLVNAAANCSVEYRRAGAILVEAGDENSDVFVLLKGAAELHDSAGDLSGRHGEHDVFGVVSSSTGRPARSTCRFIEDSVFARFAQQPIHHLRHRSIEFDQTLISMVEDRAVAEVGGASTIEPAGGSVLSVMVGSLGGRDPVTAPQSTTVGEAARIMTSNRVSSLLIVDEEQRLVGIVTDRDLRQRVVAAGLPLTTAVPEVMSPQPSTITADARAFAAMLTMTELNIHHLPIVDVDNRPVGVVSTTDLHVASTNDPVFIVGQVAKATTVQQVAEATARVPKMIRQLMAADALAESVGRLVSSVADAASRRLADLAEADLGPPPMAFAFVCFGSQARQEQSAYSDQDNALILEREPTESEREYFSRWATLVCDGLNAAGYRHCPGDIMATNPRWAVGLDQWRQYVTQWVTTPTPEAVLNAAVFFDARHLHGRAELTRKYRSWSLAQASAHPLFLGQLAANGAEFKPPIGFFRRFVVEKDGEHRDQLDLKTRGVTPVIELARVLALDHRIEATNTFDRLRALGLTPALAPDDALDLSVALEHVGYYRLQHQRRQVEVGQAPDNFVDPDDLSRLERDDLKRAFVAIAAHQDGLRRRFDTGSMG